MHTLMIGATVCLYYIHSFYYIRVYYKGVLLYLDLCTVRLPRHVRERETAY